MNNQSTGFPPFTRQVLMRLDSSIALYTIQSRILGVARTVIASAQLIFLLLTPSTSFLVPSGNDPPMVKCRAPLGPISVLCHTDTEIARSLLLLLLAVVASGLLPRLLSWIHFYASLCIALVIDLPEGGDYVAVPVTLWLAISSLSDGRRWHWQKALSEQSGKFSVAIAPVSWAAAQMLKLQMAFIYLVAGLTKISNPAWTEGNVLYYIVRSDFSGPAGSFQEFERWATAIPLFSALASWGTIMVEITIAVLLLSSMKQQRFATILSLLLQTGIMATTGLITFSAIMIGAMLAATMPAWEKHGEREETKRGLFFPVDQELKSLLYNTAKKRPAGLAKGLDIDRELKTLFTDVENNKLPPAKPPAAKETPAEAPETISETPAEPAERPEEIPDTRGQPEEENLTGEGEPPFHTDGYALGENSDYEFEEYVETDGKAFIQYQGNGNFYMKALKVAPLILALSEIITITNIFISDGSSSENYVTMLLWLTGLCAIFTLLLIFPACRPYKRSSVLFLTIGLLGVIVQSGWNLEFPGNVASWIWIGLSLILAVIGLFLNAVSRQGAQEPEPEKVESESNTEVSL